MSSMANLLPFFLPELFSQHLTGLLRQLVKSAAAALSHNLFLVDIVLTEY